jgi:hypothetical protein
MQPRYIPQQAPLEVMQYSASPIYPPRDNQRYGTCLTHETKLKTEELNRLMNKYRKYRMNPDGIIQWANILALVATIRLSMTS